MKRWMVFGACLLLLTGCVPRTNVVEELQLVQAYGFDYVDEYKFRGVAGSSVILPGEEVLPKSVIFTATGETSRLIRKQMQTQSSKQMVQGRIGLTMINKELAAQGIFNFLDNLQRDPMIGRNMRMAIVEGTTVDLLSGDYSLDISVYQYLNDLIEQSTKEIFPDGDLHKALYQYYGEGMDIFLPVMEKQGDRVGVVGLALFKDDVFVQQLDARDASFFKLMYESFAGGYYQVEMEDNIFVSLESVNAAPSYTISEDQNGIHVTLDVNVTGLINEKEEIDVSKEINIEKIKKAGTEEFEERMNALIHTFQEQEIDPLGIGDRARSKISHLDMDTWYEQYPGLNIEVEAHLEVISSGIVD
ncbi:Ger(x)C family spore germination protein [Shouchella shacheensis]|uniref:Ger(x)C family spore germination protein n=1 Tax=Shouchella shacheensis TaxID=1649580 RepID=UPI00073FE5CD|nr:Ger(x)C family spore germination protein [Shouchella shacheensis]